MKSTGPGGRQARIISIDENAVDYKHRELMRGVVEVTLIAALDVEAVEVQDILQYSIVPRR